MTNQVMPEIDQIKTGIVTVSAQAFMVARYHFAFHADEEECLVAVDTSVAQMHAALKHGRKEEPHHTELREVLEQAQREGFEYLFIH